MFTGKSQVSLKSRLTTILKMEWRNKQLTSFPTFNAPSRPNMYFHQYDMLKAGTELISLKTTLGRYPRFKERVSSVRTQLTFQGQGQYRCCRNRDKNATPIVHQQQFIGSANDIVSRPPGVATIDKYSIVTITMRTVSCWRPAGMLITQHNLECF